MEKPKQRVTLEF